jgi:N4-(beta-N-acetylglucosaminyl)-L-asparaginase
LKSAKYKPVANSANHDTIGMLAIDARGNLSGACTTSGMAWKLHGRVGDSPIIGASLYVDNEVGAATSTGVGEEVIRSDLPSPPRPAAPGESSSAPAWTAAV